MWSIVAETTPKDVGFDLGWKLDSAMSYVLNIFNFSTNEGLNNLQSRECGCSKKKMREKERVAVI
jgi:hypothetical protein